MPAGNYDHVMGQLLDAGLLVDYMSVDGSIHRVHVEGDREKRGWYCLHEIQGKDGATLIVGSFGVWRGSDNGSRKVALSKADELSDDQKDALKARLAADRRRVAAQKRVETERAQLRADAVWRKCTERPPQDVEPDYLTRKSVGGHGVRYTPSGSVVIPMADAVGRIHGLQFILSKSGSSDRIKRIGRDKQYWPKGLAKRGHFHLIGSPVGLVLLAEGYATAASLHEATGHPVAVAFDAGNLLPVAQALRNRYKEARILICADDDYLTDGNPGVTAASAVAMAVHNSAWVAPVFQHDRNGRKLTDFNDLHAEAGLLLVRSQIEAKILEAGWAGAIVARDTATGGGGDADSLRFDLQAMVEHFCLIYGTETVFDGRLARVIGLGALRCAAGRDVVRAWQEHPERKITLPEHVGFDPSGTDHDVHCNLWCGWPTVPRAGSCEKLLELLAYLTSNEENGPELFSWIIRWIAYPIQHPGAKMVSSLLMHGPEGTGKNTFFAAVRKIYGRYGTQFGQTELESNFNGWASGKLFGLGNEVVSRAELYHIKGRLKTMISEEEWVINEKMLPTRSEQNHCNFAFFSNRIDIANLDHDDRRYCVVWTPPKLDKAFYAAVNAEARNGGSEALHQHLLDLDLDGFDEYTEAPRTKAKEDLINIGMDSTERFWLEWTGGEIDGVPCHPCRTTDLYELYRVWAQREGLTRSAQRQTLLTSIGKKPNVRKVQDRYMVNGAWEKKMIMYPPDRNGQQCTAPNDRPAAYWLGDMVMEFADAVGQWRGGQ